MAQYGGWNSEESEKLKMTTKMSQRCRSEQEAGKKPWRGMERHNIGQNSEESEKLKRTVKRPKDVCQSKEPKRSHGEAWHDGEDRIECKAC